MIFKNIKSPQVNFNSLPVHFVIILLTLNNFYNTLMSLKLQRLIKVPFLLKKSVKRHV